MASITTRQTQAPQGQPQVTVAGVPLSNTQLDNNFINLNTELSEKLPLAGGTITGSLVHGLNLAAKFGDTAADNYSDIYHYSGTAGAEFLGFPNEHGNAFAIINQQGTTNEALILGDTSLNTGTGVLFGIGHSSDGGTTWSKRLELLGTGSFKRDGNLIWDAGNDGTGSGLDADLLDGQQGSYYLDWTNVTNKPDPQITVTLTGDVTGTANTTLTDLASGTVSVATTVAAINSTTLATGTANSTTYLRGDRTWATVTLPSGQTAGSTTAGYLQYSGNTKTDGQLYGGTTAPSNTTRLNFDGHLHATKFFGDGSSLTGISTGNYNVSVVSTNTNAVSETVYILTASLTLTLPASPAVGNWVRISNRSNTTTSIINRNGNNIMSIAENMNVDVLNATLTLVYVNPSLGWTLI